MNRDRTDQLVDRWLDWLVSSVHDVGWHSGGLLEMLKMPHVQGRTDLKDMKTISELRYLQEKPEDFDLIDIALGRLQREDPKAWLAILARRFYRYNYQDPETLKTMPYQDSNRASLIGQKTREFTYNLKKGYAHVGSTLDILEIGMQINR